MSKRRGETLIEVVVSFAIMSFVMMGISGLMTQLVGMITESRTVTQATALAEQGLVDGVAMVNSRCEIRGETLPEALIPSHIDSDTRLNQEVKLDDLASEDQATSPALPAGSALSSANGFRKVVSSVTWRNKAGVGQQYTLVQVVHR